MGIYSPRWTLRARLSLTVRRSAMGPHLARAAAKKTAGSGVPPSVRSWVRDGIRLCSYANGTSSTFVRQRPLNEAHGEIAEPKYCIMRTRVRIYLDDILRLLGPQNV